MRAHLVFFLAKPFKTPRKTEMFMAHGSDEVIFSKTQENSQHDAMAWVLLCETADNNIKVEVTEEK